MLFHLRRQGTDLNLGPDLVPQVGGNLLLLLGVLDLTDARDEVHVGGRDGLLEAVVPPCTAEDDEEKGDGNVRGDERARVPLALEEDAPRVEQNDRDGPASKGGFAVSVQLTDEAKNEQAASKAQKNSPKQHVPAHPAASLLVERHLGLIDALCAAAGVEADAGVRREVSDGAYR